MPKFWCCGRPSRSSAHSPERPAHDSTKLKALLENVAVVQQPEVCSWVAEAAIAACNKLAELAARGSSACWPSRLVSQLHTLNNILTTSCARLVIFARTPGGSAACVMSASKISAFVWERPPAAQGWTRTALHDKLTQAMDDPDNITIINRTYDAVNGPDASSLASSSLPPQPGSAAAPPSPTGPAAASAGAETHLRPGDLLALPVTCNGRVAAALLLSWGVFERPARQRATSGKKTPSASLPSSGQAVGAQRALEQRALGVAQQQQQQLPGDTGVALGRSDLWELRRLAQFVGFGLFSDPQQALYLEQVACLLSEISHGAYTGLHDIVSAVLEAVPVLLRTKMALPLQPLLAAVLGQSVPAVVFARRPGAVGSGGGPAAGGGSQVIATPVGSRAGHMLLGTAGSVGPPASGANKFVLGVGSMTGMDSRSGSRRHLGRDPSIVNLAVQVPPVSALRSMDLLEGAGAAGSPLDGYTCTGTVPGVSRVKVVRTALAYTLLQRLLRSSVYTALPVDESIDGTIPISALVVPDASSQVLEEEQPGRDVLLAANLTGAGVACMLLCAEAAAVLPGIAGASVTPVLGQSYTAGGGAAAGAPPGWSLNCPSLVSDQAQYGSVGGSRSRGDGGTELSNGMGRSALAAVAAAAAMGSQLPGSGRLGELLPLLPGEGKGAGAPGSIMSSSSGGPQITAAMGTTLPYRLALYLVSGDAVPAAVLDAAAEEMRGLMPLVFSCVHAAIAAGGVATAEWCSLQTQLLHRATTSGNLDVPNMATTPTPSDRRQHQYPPQNPQQPQRPQGPQHPQQQQPQQQLQPGQPPGRSPVAASPVMLRSPRGGASAAASPLVAPFLHSSAGATGVSSPSIMRRGSLGGATSGSRLRLASPAPLASAGDPLLESDALALTSSTNHDDDGGQAAAAGGGGREGGAAQLAAAGQQLLRSKEDDLILSTVNVEDMESAIPMGQPAGHLLGRKASAPCYLLSSPLLRLEDVAGPRPLELLVSSARTRLTAVAAGSDAGEEARLAVIQDLAAVDLHEVIGSGGQGVVFRGTLHGLETAVKVWEHNGRGPLEHDGEWLTAEGPEQGWNGPATSSNGNGGGGGNGLKPDGGPEALASSKDCIRQAKRGAMEVAVTVTLSHPNVVQTYAHFSDVVVVERQMAPSAALGGPGGAGAGAAPALPQLRLCAHDDPVFRGQKAGPLNTVLCLEYCDAGTLLSAARRGDFRLPDSGPRDGPVWPDVVPLYTSLLEVALALRYLHSRRLVHCDLKPGNVLLKTAPRDPRGWTCKLSDFGCVRLMDEVGADNTPGFRMAQVFGTVAYMAPECFSRGRLLGAPLDVYAFGILMWELMHCKPPYGGIDPKELPRMVTRNGIRPEFHPLAPQEFRTLAARCWLTAPERRPTSTQLVAQLQQLLAGAKAVAAQQQHHKKTCSAVFTAQPHPTAQRPQPQPPQPQPQSLQPQPSPQPPQQPPQAQPQASAAAPPNRPLTRYPSATMTDGRLCNRVVLGQALAQHAQAQAQAHRGSSMGAAPSAFQPPVANRSSSSGLRPPEVAPGVAELQRSGPPSTPYMGGPNGNVLRQSSGSGLGP